MQNLRPHLMAIAGLAVIIIITFHSVLLSPKPVVANDAPLTTHYLNASGVYEGKDSVWRANGYLGKTGSPRLNHSILSKIGYSILRPGEIKNFFPPKYANTIVFPLCAFLAGVGMYLFLITMKLKPLAAFTGACALMLSGQFITGVFSGHTGSFYMFFYMSFCLWLLTFAIQKRSIIAFIWAGIAGGMGLTSQLDIGAIVALFLAAWVIFYCIHTRSKAQWLKLAVGLLLAAALGITFSASTIYKLAGLANTSQGKTGITNGDTRTPAEKWDWATQWSLPKSETLTFVMPGFFGWGEHHRDYWGNIGRSAAWPKGLRRFSINTQGTGVAAIALALLAVFVVLPQKNNRAILIFWLIALILALLFAWGRHLDFAPTSAKGFGPYRLFYWLPKMDTMRNPLKFLYPFIIAIATLSAFGMQYLLVTPESETATHSHSKKSHKRRKK